MLARCEKHNLEYEKSPFQMIGFSFLSQCPECVKERKAKMEQEEEEERKIILFEKKERERIERLKRLNIEPEFYNATFKNYIAETETQRQAKWAVQELVKGNLQKVILLGENGVGKSHLGSVAVNETDGLIMTAYEIGVFIRGGVATGKEHERLEYLSSVSLLVVDEMGRTKMSEAERYWHSYIFDKRHVRGLRSMVLSNHHYRRDCRLGGCPKCFENLLDDDSISRFMQRGYTLTVQGRDYRRINGTTIH